MNLFRASLLLLTLTCVDAQIRFDTATRIEKSDPIYPVLQTKRQEMAQAYENSNLVDAKFSDWISIDSQFLEGLFPTLRFAAISWSESVDPQATENPLGLAIGLETTYIVEPAKNQIVGELFSTGNYEPFGQLLAEKGVKLKNLEDAQFIWNAFCDLHHKHWRSQPAEKISEYEWHLGKASIGGFHYFYKVSLGADHVVKSAVLCAVPEKEAQQDAAANP